MFQISCDKHRRQFFFFSLLCSQSITCSTPRRRRRRRLRQSLSYLNDAVTIYIYRDVFDTYARHVACGLLSLSLSLSVALSKKNIYISRSIYLCICKIHHLPLTMTASQWKRIEITYHFSAFIRVVRRAARARTSARGRRRERERHQQCLRSCHVRIECKLVVYTLMNVVKEHLLLFFSSLLNAFLLLLLLLPLSFFLF